MMADTTPATKLGGSGRLPGDSCDPRRLAKVGYGPSPLEFYNTLRRRSALAGRPPITACRRRNTDVRMQLAPRGLGLHGERVPGPGIQVCLGP